MQTETFLRPAATSPPAAPDPYAPAGLTILLVVAHPDDETIGAGAFLAERPAAAVLHVTDGAPRDPRDAQAAGYGDRAHYAAARRRELAAALAEAADGAAAHRPLLTLGVADQEASLDLAGLARRLAGVFDERSPEVVLTHPYEGGHPDHDAVAFAVHAAARLRARAGRPAPRLVELTSYHADDGRLATGTFLPAPGAVGYVEHVVPLDGVARRRKRRMLAAYASQAATLAPFGVECERFRRAPAYRFTEPPHRGPLWYERYDWGWSGARWRALAAAALGRLALEEPL